MPFCDTPSGVKNPRASTISTDPKKGVTNLVDGLTDTCYSSRNSTGQTLQVFLYEVNVITGIRLFLPKGSMKFDINTSYGGASTHCTSFDRDLEVSQWIQLDCQDTMKSADSIKISDTSPRSNVLNVCEIEVYVKDDVWCKNPPEIFIPNGHLEVSREKASLRCNSGYSEGENTRLVCDKNNNWAGPNLQCNEIFCDLSYGNSSGFEWRLQGNKPSVGSRRVLQCQKPDFTMTGQPDSVTCQKDGTWTPTDAKCVRKEVEKNVLKIVGIAVGAVVIFIIFLCLGLTLCCIYKQKAKEVVVVYTNGEDSTTVNSEPEYSSIYYEKVTPPTMKKLPKNMISSNVPFGTLKSSTLYGK
ncbi:uncharacterized protein [Parasteatoda tepidariorum]|uniref:uncharacterized protein n=1 Tax=Parasteatoda tepidariorum TaxID=114398 RepID=UPI0039BCD0AA